MSNAAFLRPTGEAVVPDSAPDCPGGAVLQPALFPRIDGWVVAGLGEAGQGTAANSV
jgi:hypothetical protein